MLALNNFFNFFELSQWNYVSNKNKRNLNLVVSNMRCQVLKSKDLLLYEHRHHPALDTTVELKNNSVNNDVINDIPSITFAKLISFDYMKRF